MPRKSIFYKLFYLIECRNERGENNVAFEWDFIRKRSIILPRSLLNCFHNVHFLHVLRSRLLLIMHYQGKIWVWTSRQFITKILLDYDQPFCIYVRIVTLANLYLARSLARERVFINRRRTSSPHRRHFHFSKIHALRNGILYNILLFSASNNYIHTFKLLRRSPSKAEGCVPSQGKPLSFSCDFAIKLPIQARNNSARPYIRIYRIYFLIFRQI